MQRILFISIVILTALFSCSKEPVLDIREGMTFDPDSIIFESSMKGWELYSWRNRDEYRYSLITATNRIKSTEEILANPFAVNGREQLKLIIRQLPSGESIVWYGTDWISENVQGITDLYQMPSLLTQYDIYHFADINAVELTVVP